MIPEDLPLLRSFNREYGHVEPIFDRTKPDPYKQPIKQSHWQPAIAAVQKTMHRVDRKRFGVLAKGIREGLLWIDDIMDRYCTLTCGECQDPCCSADGIYYDRADLLYLAGLDADLPVGQTREQAGETCLYLTNEGCLLPRMCRPFICSWYLCEPQMILFHEEPIRFQRSLTAVLQAMRRCRSQLIALYERGMAQDVA